MQIKFTVNITRVIQGDEEIPTTDSHYRRIVSLLRDEHEDIEHELVDNDDDLALYYEMQDIEEVKDVHT